MPDALFDGGDGDRGRAGVRHQADVAVRRDAQDFGLNGLDTRQKTREIRHIVLVRLALGRAGGHQSTGRSLDPKFWRSDPLIGPAPCAHAKGQWVRLSVLDRVRRGLRPLGLVVLGLCGLSVACDARDSSPNLLEVTDLNPRSLEVGDRLTLTGSGFPEGRAAKVSFQGDVFRAGQAPLRDVTIVATAAASDPHSIAITLNNELAREFCGAGDAVHATFRGATAAAFQARESGAPPVRGILEGVVLDVNPASISKAALAAHEAEAQRFAEYAGMAVVHSEERDVLLIDTVDPDGRASRAGLLPGDALLELDGVRLASLSDLIPPPRARLSHVLVRRGDEKTPSTFGLDVSGFQPGSPSELAPAATLLGGLARNGLPA